MSNSLVGRGESPFETQRLEDQIAERRRKRPPGHDLDDPPRHAESRVVVGPAPSRREELRYGGKPPPGGVLPLARRARPHEEPVPDEPTGVREQVAYGDLLCDAI